MKSAFHFFSNQHTDRQKNERSHNFCLVGGGNNVISQQRNCPSICVRPHNKADSVFHLPRRQAHRPRMPSVISIAKVWDIFLVAWLSGHQLLLILVTAAALNPGLLGARRVKHGGFSIAPSTISFTSNDGIWYITVS